MISSSSSEFTSLTIVFSPMVPTSKPTRGTKASISSPTSGVSESKVPSKEKADAEKKAFEGVRPARVWSPKSTSESKMSTAAKEVPKVRSGLLSKSSPGPPLPPRGNSWEAKRELSVKRDGSTRSEMVLPGVRVEVSVKMEDNSDVSKRSLPLKAKVGSESERVSRKARERVGSSCLKPEMVFPRVRDVSEKDGSCWRPATASSKPRKSDSSKIEVSPGPPLLPRVNSLEASKLSSEKAEVVFSLKKLDGSTRSEMVLPGVRVEVSVKIEDNSEVSKRSLPVKAKVDFLEEGNTLESNEVSWKAMERGGSSCLKPVMVSPKVRDVSEKAVLCLRSGTASSNLVRVFSSIPSDNNIPVPVIPAPNRFGFRSKGSAFSKAKVEDGLASKGSVVSKERSSEGFVAAKTMPPLDGLEVMTESPPRTVSVMERSRIGSLAKIESFLVKSTSEKIDFGLAAKVRPPLGSVAVMIESGVSVTEKVNPDGCSCSRPEIERDGSAAKIESFLVKSTSEKIDFGLAAKVRPPLGSVAVMIEDGFEVFLTTIAFLEFSFLKENLFSEGTLAMVFSPRSRLVLEKIDFLVSRLETERVGLGSEIPPKERLSKGSGSLEPKARQVAESRRKIIIMEITFLKLPDVEFSLKVGLMVGLATPSCRI